MKDISDIIAIPLTSSINQSLQSGIFPDKLNIAKVVPIFKAGKYVIHIIIAMYIITVQYNYGRAYPDFSVLTMWNGMSGHRLTEGGTECLGGIFQTGSMCGPCRQLALGPSA